MKINNNRGQSLTEYLLLTALLAVASMGIVRLMGQSVAGQFANITKAIQGGNQQAVQFQPVAPELYQKRDMSDFMQDAVHGSSSGHNGGGATGGGGTIGGI